MIVTTIYLAAMDEGSGDPWGVLGNSGAERLAIGALADLTLARHLAIGPETGNDSPAGRRLDLLVRPVAPRVLAAAHDELSTVSKQLDIDRAVRALRDLAPTIEQELIDAGDLVPAGQKGMFKKRTTFAPVAERVAAARQRIRSLPEGPTLESRVLAVLATTGLPRKRLHRLAGGALDAPVGALDPFEPYDPGATAPDGAPIGTHGAELLSALTVVLAATSDTTGWADD
jgi:hypothetical protein